MAKQKRLNKNLVAFLTIMGMVLFVSVFTLIVWQQSRRDPEVLAAAARDSEQGGDLEEAARRYVRAWEASTARGQPDPKYIIAAANCAFAMGDLTSWRSLLEKASSQMPQDRSLLEAMLEGLWRTHVILGETFPADMWRDSGRRLVDLAPDDPLGLVSMAQGLWGMGGPEDRAEADAAVQKAYEKAPHDPRVALTYARYLLRLSAEEQRAATLAGQRPAEISQLIGQHAQRILGVLAAAVAENPSNVHVVVTYAAELQREAGRLDREGKADQAGELLAQAGAVLDKALELLKDKLDPDLCLAAARHALILLERANPEVKPEQVAELQPQVAQIDELARKAIELDKAMFDAYTMRADLALQYATDPEGRLLPDSARLERAIAVLEEAMKSTVTLRSIRAVLRARDRLLMLRRAFDIGLAYFAQATTDQERTGRLKRVEVFLDDARTKYPESAVTAYMNAKDLMARNDIIGAISALEEACRKADQDPFAKAVGLARFWLAYVRLPQLPEEQLAVMYSQREQWGQAQKYASQAIKEYEDVEVNPPVHLVATAGELLSRIGQPQEALDLLNKYRRVYANEPVLLGTLASVLNSLGRTEEAKRYEQMIPDSGLRTTFWRANQALERKDYAEVVRLLRPLLDDSSLGDNEYREALRRVVEALRADGKSPEALALVQQVRQAGTRPALAQLLAGYELELTVPDAAALTPEERAAQDARWEEIIRQNPDPFERARQFYALKRTRALEAERRGEGELAASLLKEALAFIEEMRRLRPDDMSVVEEEFAIRLMQRDFARASQLAGLLSKHQDGLGWDRAGGAVYRGELSLAQGNVDLAISEFRHAVQVLPKSADLQTKLARAYLLANRLNEGIEALRAAVEVNPRGFEPYVFLRQAYRQRAGQSVGAERQKFEKLAAECETKAAEISPNHPLVQAWKEETAEDRDPLGALAKRERLRAEKPDDGLNLARMAELYVSAWEQLAAGQDEAARAQLIERAAQFFESALATSDGELQFTLARHLADFFSRSKQAEKGEALLRGLVERRSDELKVALQLLVAAFFEALGNPDAAEREYQQAQRLVRQVTSDAALQTRLDLQVGLAFVAFHERQRRPDKVVEACRWILDRTQPTDETQRAIIRSVRLTMIQALVNAQQWADAGTELAEFMQLFPGDLQALILRAQLYLNTNQYDQALGDLNRILEAQPDNLAALYSRGRLALLRGQYERARADLSQAEALLDRGPWLEPELRRQLASLHMRTQNYEQAAGQMRALLESLDRQGAAPEQTQAVVRQLARLLYDTMSQFDQARRLVSEYMEKHPDQAIWPFELGRLFEAQGTALEREADQARLRGEAARERDRREAARQAYATAETYYQRAVELAAPHGPVAAVGAMIGRMGAMRQAGREREALELFRAYPFDQLPTPIRADVRTRMGMEAAKALQSLRQDDAARQQWLQCLLDAGAAGVSLAGEVVTELRQRFADRPAEVEALLREALERRPADSVPGQRLRIVLASHLTVTRKLPEALSLLGELQQNLRSGTPEHLAVMLGRAQALEMSRDFETAIRTYREVLEIYGDSITALNNLAYLLVSTDPPQYAPAEARKYADRLRNMVAGHENAASLLDTIGWVYFHNNELDLAVAALEEAISQDANNPAIQLHLAKAYQKVGRTSDARRTLTRGVEALRQRGETERIAEFEEVLQQLTP